MGIETYMKQIPEFSGIALVQCNRWADHEDPDFWFSLTADSLPAGICGYYCQCGCEAEADD